ncbi:ankyrin, partial [Trichodelitschia bisporula]
INATYGRDKHTALHIAIGTVMVQGDDLRWKRGQITKAVKKLLEYGADTAARDVIGLTPVHYCIKSQNLDALEVLIGKGANVNVEDKMGRTPLWLL